jgi:hypothetical protein
MPGCSKNSFYSLLFFMIRDISYLHVLDQNWKVFSYLLPFLLSFFFFPTTRKISNIEKGSTAYEIFLAKLKHPSASEVVKSLERFISHVSLTNF